MDASMQPRLASHRSLDNADIQRELHQLGLRDSPPRAHHNEAYRTDVDDPSWGGCYIADIVKRVHATSARATSLDIPLPYESHLGDIWSEDIRSSSAPANPFQKPSPQGVYPLERYPHHKAHHRLNRTSSLGARSLNDIPSLRHRSLSCSSPYSELIDTLNTSKPRYDFRPAASGVHYPGYVEPQDFLSLPKGAQGDYGYHKRHRTLEEALIEKELIASVEEILRNVHAGIQESYIRFDHCDDNEPPPPQPVGATLRDPPPSPVPPYSLVSPSRPVLNGIDPGMFPSKTRLISPGNASMLSKQMGFMPIKISPSARPGLGQVGPHLHHGHSHGRHAHPHYRDERPRSFKKSGKAMRKLTNIAAVARGSGIKVLKIKRNSSWGPGFGFSIKGSLEGGLGVYVSRVEDHSPSWVAGLRPGDILLAANGNPVSQMDHTQIISLLKTCQEISLTVAATSQISEDPTVSQRYTWITPEGRPTRQPQDFNPRLHQHQVLTITINIGTSEGLGLMIRGGAEFGLGVFVTGVDEGSAAKKAGLKVGDQIIEVNGENFLRMTHDTAVGILKHSRDLQVTLRRLGKIPHSCTTYQRSKSEDGRIRLGKPEIHKMGLTRSNLSYPQRDEALAQTLTMIEEKSKTLLNGKEHAQMISLVNDYIARLITFQQFLDASKVILCTPEKTGLLTELREVIRDENITEFDNCIYQPPPLITVDHGNFSFDSNWNKDFVDILEANGSCGDYFTIEGDPYESDSQDSPLLHPIFSQTGSEILPPGIGHGIKCMRNACRISSREHTYHKKKATNHSSTSNGFCDQGRTRSSEKDVLLADRQMKSDRQTDSKKKTKAPKLHGANYPSHTRNRGSSGKTSHTVIDECGNSRVIVAKTKPILGIAIEGGTDTNHQLPRIINITSCGAASDARDLRVGQILLKIDHHSLEGKTHGEVAKTIANVWNRKCTNSLIEFVVANRTPSVGNLRKAAFSFQSQVT